MIFTISQDNFFPNVRLMGFSRNSKDRIHIARTSLEYIFYYIVSGELFLEEEGEKYHLKPGDFIWLEAGKHHLGYQKSKCKYYYVHVNQEDYLQIADNSTHLFIKKLKEDRKLTLASDPHYKNVKPAKSNIVMPKYFTITNRTKHTAIITILQGAVDDFYSKYDNYKLLASSRFLEVLILLYREYVSSLFYNQDHHDVSLKTLMTVNKLIDYIQKNYHQKLNIEIVEEYMGYNYDYLNELLKKQYKITIRKMIQNVRVEAAKKMIRETDLNFSEIAYLVGINDPYYFSKLFKSVAGLTPSKYSNQCKFEMQEFNIINEVVEK